MRLVPDASVAVKWIVAEEDSLAAETLLVGNELHAPRLMVSEIANALWSKVRRGQILQSQTDKLIASATEQPVQWTDDGILVVNALRFAVEVNHPIYDCIYLALAYRINGTVVTADRRFYDAVAPTEHAERVVLLADFAAAQG